ncbi:MAG: 30S ribosomal protein S9 [Puniceicoccales bacterium]|jgi:small subunit ribosomal protein S9|nr:30S ribosomal protein S9 [Puniceicoccales bacterium]
MTVAKVKEEFRGTGRRKTAVAQVRISRGTGKFSINDLTATDYCNEGEFIRTSLRPASLVEMDGMLNIHVRVNGGGVMGQAGAISHGLARALVSMQPELRVGLKREGMLTRDSRMKERKKPGQPGARKRFQFSKR